MHVRVCQLSQNWWLSLGTNLETVGVYIEVPKPLRPGVKMNTYSIILKEKEAQ